MAIWEKYLNTCNDQCVKTLGLTKCSTNKSGKDRHMDKKRSINT